MNKKKLLISGGAVALLLLIVLAGLPLFSRLFYGRSQAATLFAWQLKKEAYSTEEAFDVYLAEKKLENRKPHTLPLEIYLPVSCRPIVCADQLGYELNRRAEEKTIFYFPGGSYIDQPREVHWQFLGMLAERAGVRIVVPLYPKLPENDASASYEAVTDFYLSYLEEQEPENVIFMGDSAGGGMALSLAMQLRDAGLPGPDKLILICPWPDITLTNPDIPSYERRDPALDSEQLRHLGALWAGDMDPTDPIVSPLYGSFEDLGSIILITGTGELLYPDIAALDEILTRQGADHELAVWKGMFHVWPLYEAYSIPEADEAVEYILEQLD